MTFIGRNNNQTINLLEFPIFDDNNWKCTNCNEKLIYVDNYYIGDSFWRNHFRHYVKCKFETEPETKAHLEMKEFFYNLFKKNLNYKVDIEKKIGDRITDVLIDISNKQVAIECQSSLLSQQDLIERTESYNKSGVYALWILNADVKNFYRTVKNTAFGFYNVIKLRQIERILHRIYFGRIYYYENGKVFSRHFVGSKRKRKVGVSEREISNFSLLLTGNKFSPHYLIARFFDKVWWKNE